MNHCKNNLFSHHICVSHSFQLLEINEHYSVQIFDFIIKNQCTICNLCNHMIVISTFSVDISVKQYMWNKLFLYAKIIKIQLLAVWCYMCYNILSVDLLWRTYIIVINYAKCSTFTGFFKMNVSCVFVNQVAKLFSIYLLNNIYKFENKYI